MAGAHSYEGYNIPESRFNIRGGRGSRRSLSRRGPVLGGKRQLVLETVIAKQPFGHFRNWEHPVNHASSHRCPRHAGAFGFVGILGDGQATSLFNAPHSDGAIPVSARQNHGCGVRSMSVGQGTKKQIYCHAFAAFALEVSQFQVGGYGRQILSWWYYVNRIRGNLGAIDSMDHRHRGRPSQQIWENGLVLWGEMDDDNEDHPRIGRHRFKERLQGSDAPR